MVFFASWRDSLSRKFFDCFSVNLSLGKCPLFALGAVHLCIGFWLVVACLKGSYDFLKLRQVPA